MNIEILGVHAIHTEEHVHLIEAQIQDFTGAFDFGQLTQPMPNLPESNWQVAWQPYLLSPSGDSGEIYSDFCPVPINQEQRVAFFLHYLDLNLPIFTPFGPVALPSESEIPERLNFVFYSPVD